MVMVVMLLMRIQLGGIQQGLVAVGAHDVINLLAGQLIPRRGDDAGVLTRVLTDQLQCFIQALFTDVLRAAQDNCACALQLIVVELTEVLDIHAALGGIADNSQAAHLDLTLFEYRLDSSGDIGQLTDAGRLDDDAVRGELLEDIVQRLAEIADQRAADAAGIHLSDFNAGILEKAAVNADLTEFVFDEDDFFALQRAFQQLADQRGFACAEKAGNNVNFRHIKHLLLDFINDFVMGKSSQ